MNYFLAIDSGGTKADYVLADETRELARARSGTIKRMRTDAGSAAANLDFGLQQLALQSGVSLQSITRTCIGTAGETVPLVTHFLREALPARVSGELILVGDVEIALDAAFHGGPGVLVLAGTGSNVAGRMLSGELIGAGGWGPALADQGSGHRIGEQALRSAFLAIDEARPTTLLDAILDFWNLEDRDGLVDFANRIPGPDFSTLCELVLRCANAGDPVAQSVLAREGAALGHLVQLVVRRIALRSAEASATSNPPALAFAGSIMEKVPPVREALVAVVRAEFPTLHALPGVVDPTDGALWRARNPSPATRAPCMTASAS